jgi:DEAD/DEAH box helicase domain-containing protein
MTIDQLLDYLKRDRSFMEKVSLWKELPARAAQFAPYPTQLDARLVSALQEHGIQSLYSHQAVAIESILKGNNTVIVTPTASGKTICYNVPVLNAVLNDEDSRSL